MAFAESEGGALRERPHVLGLRVVGYGWLPMHLPKKGVQEFRILQAAWVSLSMSMVL